MFPLLRVVIEDEDGAVTVDWIVLTAAAVGLAAAGGISAGLGVGTASTNVSNGVAAVPVSNAD